MHNPVSPSYLCLSRQVRRNGEYSIVPIRSADRYKIMQWRNEQMYHLRQKEELTKDQQDHYFDAIIPALFNIEQPNQLLFSYLKNDEIIGYGGLVHINWTDQHAEVSFIMETAKEATEFDLHWYNFTALLSDIAFLEIGFHKIFTYAYNLRPHLYPALEKSGFTKMAHLPEHCFFEGKFIDVVMHQKFDVYKDLSIREIQQKDNQLLFDWANDKQVRNESFNSQAIPKADHDKWFNNQIKNPNKLNYILEVNGQPAGNVRLEREGEEGTIGVLISDVFRGKGLAVKMIKLGSQLFFSKGIEKINAWIKTSNLASQKSFKRAGFVFEKEELVNGVPSVLLILLKNE